MKRLFAEFLGTFGLVFAGTGAIIINQQSNGAITHPGIALTFGLVVIWGRCWRFLLAPAYASPVAAVAIVPPTPRNP